MTLLITTGGTIGALPYPDPIHPPACATMPQGRDLVVETVTALGLPCTCLAMEHVDSNAIDRAYRDRPLAALLASGADHAVITHGTDTILETADYLVGHRDLLAAKTIVLVGAMTPLANGPDSDGHTNLSLALAQAHEAAPGIYIVLSDWNAQGQWAPVLYPHTPGAYRKHRGADGRRYRLVLADTSVDSDDRQSAAGRQAVCPDL